MDQAVDLLQQLLAKMTQIATTLEIISAKLDAQSGVYGVDDVVRHIDRAVESISGFERQTLTSVCNELKSVTSGLADINTSIMLKD